MAVKTIATKHDLRRSLRVSLSVGFAWCVPCFFLSLFSAWIMVWSGAVGGDAWRECCRSDCPSCASMEKTDVKLYDWLIDYREASAAVSALSRLYAMKRRGCVPCSLFLDHLVRGPSLHNAPLTSTLVGGMALCQHCKDTARRAVKVGNLLSGSSTYWTLLTRVANFGLWNFSTIVFCVHWWWEILNFFVLFFRDTYCIIQNHPPRVYVSKKCSKCIQYVSFLNTYWIRM